MFGQQVRRRTVLGSGLGAAAATIVGGTVATAATPGTIIASTTQRFAVVADQTESPEIVTAVAEIVTHVVAVTGRQPDVVTTDPGRPAIWLGAAAQAKFADLVAPEAPHGFALRAAPEAVAIVGGSARGTLYGVYELLERCGVRWLTPGPHGTTLPQGQLALDACDLTNAPVFAHRVLQGLNPYVAVPAGSPVDRTEAAEWYRRNRLDDVAFGSHVLPMWPVTTNKTDPDLYIMGPTGAPTAHLDVTIPEVLDRAEAGIRRLLESQPDMEYLNIGPADGTGFGETEWDVPGRIDPLYGELVVTDRFIRFFNLLLERLDDYPDLKIAFYAYATYMEPPLREKPNPRIVPVFAPITPDRRKSVVDGDGWERRYVLRVIEEWKALGVDWMYRGYLGNLADPGLPYSAAPQMAAEFSEFARLGASGGIRLEVIAGWGQHGPAIYLASKLMWDPNANAAAILRDWFRAAYGPAAAPMRAYYDQLESTIARAPYTAGGMFDMAASLPDSVLASLQSSLSQATRQARTAGAAVASRIALVQQALSFGVEVLAGWRANLNGDTSTAVAALARARASHDAAMATSPAPLYPAGKLYLDRYLGLSVDQIAAAREGQRLVATTPRSWRLLVDDQGHEVVPSSADGTWTSTDTWLTWSAQGLRYLKGQAWYRCTLPAVPTSGPPHLVLPWVDESSRLWINGVAAPALTAPRALAPARFDLSTGWAISGHNDILIQVTNRWLDELGTGGILGAGLVLANTSGSWSPPDVVPPSLPAPIQGPAALAAPAGAVRVGGTWHAMLDPLAAAERLSLHDRTISSQHFRDHDPYQSPMDQGLGRYRGGVVLRTEVPTGPQRILLLAASTDTTVWANSIPLKVSDAGGGWVSATVPHTPGRTATLAVGVPRLAAQALPLSPQWSRR